MSVFGMNELNNNKIYAEIARLMAETQKLSAESAKLSRESQKLMVEPYRIRRATFWYPMAVACGIVGTIATLTILLMKALSY